MNFYVAMQDIGKMDWNSANSQCSSYIFCNSAKGTLPDIYQLRTIYKNKSTINNLLLTNGGTGFLERWFYWSSTYNGGSTYNTIDMFNGQVYSGIYGWETREDDIHYVRCVLTSW